MPFFPFSSFSGLTYKKLNRLDEALDCFLKLHAILRNSAQVLHQIASMYLSERGAGVTHSAGDSGQSLDKLNPRGSRRG